ncbi:class 1 fructose-bisphosphatase [Haloarchaeobius sp. HRN-SO-5]|uniref:class 1 fructose-bisphosphatase n=1 Tax=Haloarchaeobius sp. HRN-SO-5 TaxID=3446118 RepID=UPI003EBC0BBE
MTVETVLDAVAGAVPTVRATLRRERGGKTTENPSGDVATAADEAVDDVFAERLGELGAVGAYASEERDGVLDCGTGFSVTVDPVDGSSNLRSNNTVGTVVGVYDGGLPARGTALVASVVLLYGPRTTMTVARDGETTVAPVSDGVRLDPEPVTIPDESDVLGIDGPADEWPDGASDLAVAYELRLRYTGAMVADLAHVLDRGGLAWYPTRESRPDGVLRLQYESNPVAHVVESAGGAATDGSGRLLERDPSSLHERVPTAFGSRALVEDVEAHR